MQLIRRSFSVFTLLLITTSFCHTETVSSSDTGIICNNNDYALCSHAKCECLFDDGTPGATCEAYINGTDTGWAQCKCPIVKTGHSGDTAAYNPNYAAQSCSEREQPSNKGTAFPSFVSQQGDESKIYSTYSFGDSLAGEIDNTLSNAEFIVCQQQKFMTLCLDMPCTIGEDGYATCYCQNIPVNQICSPDQACPKSSWNTLSKDCDQNKCDLGDKHVWSAAFLFQTLPAINDLTIYMLQQDAGFTDVPKYCAK